MSTTQSIPELVTKLRTLLAKASPLPWERDITESEGTYGSGPDARSGFNSQQMLVERPGGSSAVLFDSVNSTTVEVHDELDDEDIPGSAFDGVALNNFKLIETAINALPALLGEIERLSAQSASRTNSDSTQCDHYWRWESDGVCAKCGASAPSPAPARTDEQTEPTVRCPACDDRGMRNTLGGEEVCAVCGGSARLKNGQPCHHRMCASHARTPCEGCGRLACTAPSVATPSEHTPTSQSTDPLADEKRRRAYYQDIVYAVCNIVDSNRGDGKKTVSGTVDQPSTDVQTTLKHLFAALGPVF